MTEKHFYTDFDIKLIQQLRLIQAIAESGNSVIVPLAQLYKFENLKEKFYFESSTDNKRPSKPLSEIIKINHKKPHTCIGDICRPLIFPHQICSYCRTLWNDSREIKLSFIGLVTRERKRILEIWMDEHVGKKSKNSLLAALHLLGEKIKLKIGKISHQKIGELHIFSSRKGRKYPTKAWDEQYYQILSQSQFVLCPRGKSDWTYRFFEAILCGAIPVVEKDCDVYSNFKFYQLNEPIQNLIWSREIAEYNYQLCVERITIPLPILNKTLEALLYNTE